MTRAVHVQIQPGRSPELEVLGAVERLQQLGADAPLAASVTVTEGNDDGAYVDVDFSSETVRALWTALRAALDRDPLLAACTIVCCEGSRGWNDYLGVEGSDQGSEPACMMLGAHGAHRQTRSSSSVRGRTIATISAAPPPRT